jgi:hypothetical protein
MRPARRGFTQEGTHVKPRLLAHRGASPMAEANVEFPFVRARGGDAGR